MELSLNIPLWIEPPIFALGSEAPTLTYYPATIPASGASVIVCPGGGYGGHADHEGIPVAEWLNSLGIAAFVLKYRLAPNRHPSMHDDVSRAIRTLRANSSELGLDSSKVGVLGFSAGGHLAASIATIHDDGSPGSPDPTAEYSSRPDLAILIYPVISMLPPFGHEGSAQNLLGEPVDIDLATHLSLEKRVDSSTPPCFLVHSADDEAVPIENALMFATSLSKHKIPFELHIYEHGGHGYGMAPGDNVLRSWPELCSHWLRKHGFKSI